MRKGDFFRWTCFSLYLIFFLTGSFTTLAQVDKNYVVVGAFEHEENAKEWVEYSNTLNLNARYQKNASRGLFYVYILEDESREKALEVLKEVWKLGKYTDAWIFKGDLANSPMTLTTGFSNENDQPVNVDPPVPEKPLEKKAVVETESLKTKEELREAVVVNYEADTEEEKERIDLGDFTVFFNLFNSQNNADVFGEVKIIDTERAKLLQESKSGEYISLPDPNNGTGKVTILVENFGYRNLQHEINFYDPLGDTSDINIDLIGDVKVYHFPLVRYHKGDIATMYNVYFFIDAAIMRPESAFEVGRLLTMMRENPDYKIMIHGHTNGNSHGKIITPGPDKNFFALTSDDEEGFGSAKHLSEERAKVIKDYLVANGIDAERMEIKAWGGKRMLYDKHSNQAKNNVRVEVEILED